MTTKLGAMVTYLDGPVPIKSHHPLTKWTFEKLELLYLYYYSVSDQQTGQDGMVKILYYCKNSKKCPGGLLNF